VKIMGGLNIAEKRLPQDGRIRVKLAAATSTSASPPPPTVYGERVVSTPSSTKNTVLLDLRLIHAITGGSTSVVF